MAAYLTIDVGNSSVKARCWDGSEVCDYALAEPLTPSSAADLLGQCPALRAIAVSNVGGDISAAIDVLAGAAPVISVSASTPLPICLGDYSPATSLGADRIAALCGAQAMVPGRELLVVDCGTAVTYDHLSADGRFLGGNIAPGASLRLRSLHEHTARLPQPALDGECPVWGLSTAQAMLAGALRGIAAEVLYYMAAAPGCAAILTGGQAHLVAPLLPPAVTIAPALVMEGLKRIILHNEDNC